MELEATCDVRRAIGAWYVGLVLFLPALSGCLIIPLNKEITAEEVVGQRIDQDGNVAEEIVKQTMHRNLYVVLAPCGMGKNYFAYDEFYCKKDNRLRKLSFLTGLWESSPQIEYPISAIEGSPKWIAIKEDGIRSSRLADNYFIIFDGKKMYRKLLIHNCIRINAGRMTERCAVDFTEGNRKAVIHTSDGDYLLDTVNGILHEM